MTSIDRYNYAFDPEGDAWAARLLRRLPPQGTVLELGPGPGAMTRVMVDRGYQVTVVENDPEALKCLEALGVEIIAGDLESDGWVKRLEGRRFDAILACDVLEHLREPDQALNALAGLMQPMGQLIISVPNVAYAGIVAGLTLGMFDYTEKGLLDRTHLRFFTRRGIERMLFECGWSPRSWEACRLPIERSEFDRFWSALPGSMRHNLSSICADFDVYEWMVVATLPLDAPTWELKSARSEMEKLRDEMQALKLVHAQEHASLLEHQKAFAEAKEIIASQQADVKALQSGVEKLQAEKEALAAPPPAPPTWRDRLRRRLG
ncbi:MAG: methyltransferase domain-containing protein [Burkholderiaceae bacterium]|nr:methyltransferase domain-containing protein [Burkholderiaceae bacterium]